MQVENYRIMIIQATELTTRTTASKKNSKQIIRIFTSHKIRHLGLLHNHKFHTLISYSRLNCDNTTIIDNFNDVRKTGHAS